MPEIIIKSLDSVFIAGVNTGPVADSVANYPGLASAIQTALVAFSAGLKAELETAKSELAANIDYQTEALKRAAAAVEKGDLREISDVLAFASTPSKERIRQKELTEIEALESEAAERRAKLK